MLERFRACYPTGCLISELVTIHNGKYVVRVLVRVDGETLATGLAGADTVELAEDQARKRSLAPLLLNLSISTPQTTSSSEAKTSVQLSPPKSTSDLEPQINTYVNTSLQPKTEASPKKGSNLDSDEVPHAPTVSSGLEKLEISTPLETEELPPLKSTINYDDVPYVPQNSGGFNDNWLNSDYGMKQKEEKIDEVKAPSIDSTNDIENEITTSEPIDYEIEVAQLTDINVESEEITSLNPPIDLSDDNAKIDILIDTLNWTKEQERDFLEQSYNQKTRSFLTPEQLLNFQQYLELLAKITEKVKNESWKTEQLNDYLDYNHNKQSLEQLNIDELQSFWQYLEIFSRTSKEIKRLGWNARKGKTYLKKNYGEEGRTRLSYEKLQDFLQNLEALDTPQ